MKEIKKSQKRILDISKRLGLSHIGSNLSCLPVLMEIYKKKKLEDLVILDNAHAHLAHLVVQEEYIPNFVSKIEFVIKKYGIHCDFWSGYCHASGGSLGHGIGIAIGRALANPTRCIYVIVSDGSMMEGSNWEALRIANDLGLTNLSIYCNFNGYTAVAKSNPSDLERKMKLFNGFIKVFRTTNGEGFEGVQGHYKII